MSAVKIKAARDFYPRPPRGGRQRGKTCRPLHREISIHALREEGDNFHAIKTKSDMGISIHALREEGDQDGDAALARGHISIHALREEGDSE